MIFVGGWKLFRLGVVFIWMILRTGGIRFLLRDGNCLYCAGC